MVDRFQAMLISKPGVGQHETSFPVKKLDKVGDHWHRDMPSSYSHIKFITILALFALRLGCIFWCHTAFVEARSSRRVVQRSQLIMTNSVGLYKRRSRFQEDEEPEI